MFNSCLSFILPSYHTMAASRSSPMVWLCLCTIERCTLTVRQFPFPQQIWSVGVFSAESYGSRDDAQ